MKQHLAKENVCGIVHDLLPLYVEHECTPQSHLFVEEHLKVCPECRSLCEQIVQELDNVAEILAVFPQESEDKWNREVDGQEGDNGYSNYGAHSVMTMAGLSIPTPESDRQAAKIIHRLRRRSLLWILLLLVLIVPVSWLGINEIGGEGLSYSNAYDHYQATRFLAELEQGNNVSAFNYLNMKQAYADLQQDLSRKQGLSEAQRTIYEGMTYEAFVSYSRERFVQGMEEFTSLGYRLQREGGIWAKREVVRNPLTGQRQTVYSYQTNIRLTDKNRTEQSAQMSLHTYPDSAAPHSFLIGGYIASDEGDLIGVLSQQMDYWDWGK